VNKLLKNWIAIYTKPRHEKRVAKELVSKGYHTYLPLIKERRKWSDRKKWVEFPLFKSYLFVQTRLNETITILKTPGIVKIVKFGDKIAIIDKKSIESIKILLEGGYKPKSTDYLLKGDSVTIKEGPLKGLSGEITQLQNKNYFIIRIDSIQSSISVKIDKAFLKSNKTK